MHLKYKYTSNLIINYFIDKISLFFIDDKKIIIIEEDRYEKEEKKTNKRLCFDEIYFVQICARSSFPSESDPDIACR